MRPDETMAEMSNLFSRISRSFLRLSRARAPRTQNQGLLLDVFMVEKRQTAKKHVNRSATAPSQSEHGLQLFQAAARCDPGFNRGKSVAGNGNIGVGASGRTRRPGSPAETLAGTKLSGPQIDETCLLGKESPKICIAMTQQSGEYGRGNQSAPQKLLHLVGCRDPNARLAPWVRPHPLPPKR